MSRTLKCILSALAVALCACDDACDCGPSTDTVPVTYSNESAEALALVWTHRGQDFSAHLAPGEAVRVALFDGNGCEEHWAAGLPRTALTVELCDSAIVLMGTTSQGEYYQAERLREIARYHLAEPRVVLDAASLAELAAEARRAGALAP